MPGNIIIYFLSLRKIGIAIYLLPSQSSQLFQAFPSADSIYTTATAIAAELLLLPATFLHDLLFA